MACISRNTLVSEILSSIILAVLRSTVRDFTVKYCFSANFMCIWWRMAPTVRLSKAGGGGDGGGIGGVGGVTGDPLPHCFSCHAHDQSHAVVGPKCRILQSYMRYIIYFTPFPCKLINKSRERCILYFILIKCRYTLQCKYS